MDAPQPQPNQQVDESKLIDQVSPTGQTLLLQEQTWSSPTEVPVQMIESTKLSEKIQKFDNIYLVPLFSKVKAEELKAMVPDSNSESTVVGLDFAVEGHEQGNEIRSEREVLLGIKFDNNVINIDHHIPVDEMARPISTTPLVAGYVREHGPVRDSEGKVIINHTDADSILSSLILAGKLDASDIRFSEAAIAADHTGEENSIADLLVALESKRDLQFSIFCLHQLLNGQSLPQEAQELWDKRKQQRQEVKEMVEQGLMQDMGSGVYLIESDQPLRSEFFPAVAKDAAIFVVAVALPEGGYEYKVRAGNELPLGKRLNEMGIPHFGGRWNAGGTKRQGAVFIPPKEYAQMVVERLNK